MSEHPWAPVPVQQQPGEHDHSSMAVAALLMSLVFCLPILPLVAIVLAIIVLVGGRAGRGMAIVALVVAPLALIPSVLLFTTDVVDDFRAGFEEGLHGPRPPATSPARSRRARRSASTTSRSATACFACSTSRSWRPARSRSAR